MTVDEQLRVLARQADEHQRTITVEEIAGRASGRADAGAAVLDLTIAPRRGHRSLWLAVSAAACIALVALAAEVMSDHKSVVATDPSAQPIPADGDDGVVLPGYMRFVDGPLAGGSLLIEAKAEDGQATGTIEFDVARAGMVVTLDCVDLETLTDTDGFIVWGGEVTTPPNDGTFAVGDRLFVIDRRGEPTVIQGERYANNSVMIAEGGPAGSCGDYLESAGDLLSDETNWSQVYNAGAGSDPPPEPLETLLPLAALEGGRQFRVANVTVTIQCTGTKSTPDSDMRDLVLAGVVTDNPDDAATIDGVSVAVGDLLALIIREDPGDGRRATLYDNTQWFGGEPISSCDELVTSIPTWVDGGFFTPDLPGGYEVLPSE